MSPAPHCRRSPIALVHYEREQMPGYKTTPQHLLDAMHDLDGTSFRIGNTRTYSMDDLNAGKLEFAGVTVEDDAIAYNARHLPAADERWGKWNRNGRKIDRPDLPRTEKSWSVTHPNFGNGARFGYSTRTQSRMVMRKQVLHGKGLPFLVEYEQVDDRFRFTIAVDRVFAADTAGNEPDLLMAASLTRHTTGGSRLIPTNQRLTDWAREQQMQWEFLPPGEGRLPNFEAVARRAGLVAGTRAYDTTHERFTAMNELGAERIYVGENGFARYVAFHFPRAVVLENFQYGNALYVMYEDWEELSRRSRTDLMADPEAGYTRIEHRGNWRAQLDGTLARRRQDNNQA